MGLSFRARGVGAGVTCAFSFLFACARANDGPAPPPIGTTSEAIQDGTLDGTSHPYAVGVCIGGNPGNCQALCSGALITPNLVVTARHCVQDTTEEIQCGVSTFSGQLQTNYITTNPSMWQSTNQWHSVSKIVTPPDTGVCGNDIALLILDDVIASSEATPITPGVQYATGDVKHYLKSFTAIGYGRTSEVEGTGCPANQASCSGYRRIKQNIGIVCIPGDALVDCGPLSDSEGDIFLSKNEFVSEEGICPGDSGSSAYEQSTFAMGAPVSLGVLSRGGTEGDSGAAAKRCGQAIYTRLDAWRDLIVNTAGTASNNWTLYPKPNPDWTVYIPPPSDAGPEAAPPVKQPDGAQCSTDDDCESNLVCKDTGDGLACTATCDPTAANTCPDTGYNCAAAGYCTAVPPAASTPTTTTTTTSGGCSTAPGSGTDFGMVGLAAALALTLNTRRASRRRAVK